ncbi:family A G protein-coupled receptor-like protein, partial [Basidiobolus meristosporus CBS 931.73]
MEQPENAFFLSSLVGSSISTVASFLLILCYVLLPACRTYRHRLILSLSIADFLNALSNTTSGLKMTTQGPLEEGAFCSVNGFVGQLTVQAQDFSTLLIAIVTYTAISRPLQWLHSLNFLQRYEVWLYVCVWGISFITALVGLLAIGYEPVTGNWCWLPAYPVWVRYVLTHGFRYAIIPIVFFLYIRLFILLKKSKPAEITSDETYVNNLNADGIQENIELASSYHTFKSDPSLHNGGLESDLNDEHDNSDDNSAHHSFKLMKLMTKIGLKKRGHATEDMDSPNLRRTPSNERRVHRVMLKMCLYPVIYTLCWLPG